MKKIFLILISVLLIQNVCFAKTELSFIYINGSNNNNEKMRKWFISGVNKLHPALKKRLEKNAEIQKLMLKNGEYVIDELPNIFFWGDKSKKDLEYVTQKIASTKDVSPGIAYMVRYFIVECMHDAVWVQKQHNMLPILEDLDNKVRQAAEQDKKVIMLGYSAGTFITYEYLFTKFTYINPQEIFEKMSISPKLKKFVENNPRRDTCFTAFVASDLGDVTQMGHIVPNKNEDEFIEAYVNLDYYTQKYCAPKGVLKGVINFASPLALFYSDISDESYELSIYNKLLFKYLIENDFFWITVNFREDPLGFPSGNNLTNKEIKKITGLDYDQQKGFIYDYSRAWSFRTFGGAHTSYWNAKKLFPKAIINAYIEGYNFQYNPETQKQIIKDHRNK